MSYTHLNFGKDLELDLHQIIFRIRDCRPRRSSMINRRFFSIFYFIFSIIFLFGDHLPFINLFSFSCSWQFVRLQRRTLYSEKPTLYPRDSISLICFGCLTPTVTITFWNLRLCWKTRRRPSSLWTYFE